MSQLEVDKIIPQSGTTLTLGDSGDTINFGSGVLPNFENLTVTGDLTVDTNSLYVDSTNNRVGIGTASPSQELHIVSAQPSLLLEDSDNNGQALIDVSGGNINISADPTGAVASSNIDFLVDNSQAMRITSAGNVGIGTTSPSAALEVNGGTDNEPIQVTSTDAGSYIAFADDSTTGSTRLGAVGNDFKVDVNSSERMRIDSSGRVGIGINSPSSFSSGAYNLVISQPSGSNAGITINNDGANLGSIFFANGTSETAKGRIRYNHSDDHLEISTADTERMRIDSSGNVLVGTTDESPYNNNAGSSADNGISLRGSIGKIEVARYNSVPFEANRTGSDGDIVSFRKDGSEVGSIGTNSSRTYISSGSSASGIRFDADTINPFQGSATTDNVFTLGNAPSRFKDLYLGGNIYLGGTGSANALDDYEEGTWTPTYIGSTTNPSVTYDTTVRYGEYTKIGRKVFITCVVRTDAVASTGSGELRVGGLPFTSSNEFSSATRYGFVVAGATSFNTTPVNLVAYTDVSQNYIRLNEDYGGTSFDTSELQDGANFNSIRISGFYVTTA